MQALTENAEATTLDYTISLGAPSVTVPEDGYASRYSQVTYNLKRLMELHNYPEIASHDQTPTSQLL